MYVHMSLYPFIYAPTHPKTCIYKRTQCNTYTHMKKRERKRGRRERSRKREGERKNRNRRSMVRPLPIWAG